MSDESEELAACAPARARGQLHWRAEFDAQGPVQERFQAYATARIRMIDVCHEAELRRNVTLPSGELAFSFTIAPDGRLVDVQVVADAIHSEHLVRAIVASLGHWRIPVLQGSENTPGTLWLQLGPAV